MKKPELSEDIFPEVYESKSTSIKPQSSTSLAEKFIKLVTKIVTIS